MDFSYLLEKKTIFLITVILATALYITSIPPAAAQENSNQSVIVDTRIGEFNVSSIEINDTLILWEGFTTDLPPNTTVERGDPTLKDGAEHPPSWNYTTNIYGLRSNREGKNPTDTEGSRFTVLVMGASSTLGHHVKYENTYSEKLEKKLRQKNSKTEVINAGLDYAGIIDHYLLLTTLGSEINPDVVIIGDIEYNQILARLEQKRKTKMIYNKVIQKGDKIKNPGLVTSEIDSKVVTRYLKVNTINSSNFAEYGKKIHNFTEKRDIKLYFSCNRKCNPEIEKWSSQNNISLLDQPETFQSQKDVYRFSDGHLNIKGHEVVAQDLYNSINWSSISPKFDKTQTSLK